MLSFNCRQTIKHNPQRSYLMAIVPYHQLSLADIFLNCQDIYEFDKPKFLSFL